MLGNERGRAILRQLHQQRLECLHAPGRGSDQEELARGPANLCAWARRRSPFGATRAETRARRRLDLGLQCLGQFAHRVGDIVLRLGDKVDGADFQRFQRGLRARLREGGEHHHRHRPQRHDLAQEGETVHLRHLDVERDDVGIERLDLLARVKGILRCTDDLDFRIGGKQR